MRPSLLLDTLARTSPRQLAARLARRARFRWLYPWAAPWLHPSPEPLAEAAAAADPFHESLAAGARPVDELRRHAEDLAAGRFAFLGLEPRDLGRPVDWHPGGLRLWAYHLHYGRWALDLAHATLALGEKLYRRELTALLGDWIERHPPASAPGWEPEPLARRLVAWSRLAFAWDDGEWRAFVRRTLEPSLRRQACFLARNLEHDLPNNHLLANYRALAWAGLLFERWPESRRLRRRGLTGLWRQMERQVLADGVHVERSPSYHAIVLADLLETWVLARRRGVAVPASVEPTLAGMLRFLAETRAPDGTWPRVNDGAPGKPGPAEVLGAGAVLFERREWSANGGGVYAAWLTGKAAAEPPEAGAEPPRRTLFPDAGYAVLRDGAGGYVFFDAGPIGPDAVPGHGHADVLSFVLHGGGRALVLDPGTDTYEPGRRRDELRSIAVHNTVTVDGADPCVFWGPFRVAHPPRARLLGGSETHLEGEHQGYRRSGLAHRRRLALRSAGVWEVHDRFDGQGEHDFALNLQLAPGARTELHSLDAEAIWPGGPRLRIRLLDPPPGARAEIAQGWVSESWETRTEAPRYVLRWRAAVPCECRLLLEVVAG